MRTSQRYSEPLTDLCSRWGENILDLFLPQEMERRWRCVRRGEPAWWVLHTESAFIDGCESTCQLLSMSLTYLGPPLSRRGSAPPRAWRSCRSSWRCWRRISAWATPAAPLHNLCRPPTLQCPPGGLQPVSHGGQSHVYIYIYILFLNIVSVKQFNRDIYVGSDFNRPSLRMPGLTGLTVTVVTHVTFLRRVNVMFSLTRQQHNVHFRYMMWTRGLAGGRWPVLMVRSGVI